MHAFFVIKPGHTEFVQIGRTDIDKGKNSYIWVLLLVEDFCIIIEDLNKTSFPPNEEQEICLLDKWILIKKNNEIYHKISLAVRLQIWLPV